MTKLVSGEYKHSSGSLPATSTVKQSVNFFTNYEEFPARHTALLTDGYRRQSRRLCDVWLRLRRAGDSFVPWIPLNDASAVIISVYSVISVATPVVYDSVPQSVNFAANYEEFPARHTALLTDGYRRQSRRLCDVWLRLRRAVKHPGPVVRTCRHVARATVADSCSGASSLRPPATIIVADDGRCGIE